MLTIPDFLLVKQQISGKFSRSTGSNNESVRQIQVRTVKFPAGYFSQLS